jgi:hypothetical protein
MSGIPGAPTPPTSFPNGPQVLQALQDRKDFEAVSSGADAALKASADKWLTGLALLFAVVIAGAFISGPKEASAIQANLLAPLIILIVLGIAGHVISAIMLLWVASATPKDLDYAAITSNGSVRSYLEGRRVDSAYLIRTAVVIWGVGFALLVSGLGLWLSSSVPPDPDYLKVSLADDKSDCGELISGDDLRIVLVRPGESDSVTYTYAEIKNIAIVSACG